MTAHLCPGCGGELLFMHSRKTPRKFLVCAACELTVALNHRGRPVGDFATEELRAHRARAHEVFDKLWNRKNTPTARAGARHDAYAWLRQSMGLTRKQCHFSLFTAEQCAQVIELCLTKKGFRL